MCTIIIVKCSWDGLPKGRNCVCVWSFWYSELCSIDQMVTVQRGVCWMWGVQSDFPDLLLTLDKYSSSSRVGRVVPMIRSAVRSTLHSLLWSDLVAELNQTVIDVQKTDSMMADGRTLSAAPVAGWTSSVGEGSTASAGPFSQWSLCDCSTSGPGRWWCPGIWMTPLQSQCCSWW